MYLLWFDQFLAEKAFHPTLKFLCRVSGMSNAFWARTAAWAAFVPLELILVTQIAWRPSVNAGMGIGCGLILIPVMAAILAAIVGALGEQTHARADDLSINPIGPEMRVFRLLMLVAVIAAGYNFGYNALTLIGVAFYFATDYLPRRKSWITSKLGATRERLSHLTRPHGRLAHP